MTHTFTIHSQYINDGFQAVQAQPEDTEEVLSLLAETASWLKSKGSSQWNALLQGEDSHDTPSAIRRGDVFVFKKKRRLLEWSFSCRSQVHGISSCGEIRPTRKMGRSIYIDLPYEENMLEQVWGSPYWNGRVVAYNSQISLSYDWIAGLTMSR